jgi:hypothetical protein
MVANEFVDELCDECKAANCDVQAPCLHDQEGW